jgi:small subunit ribosomal protein S6
VAVNVYEGMFILDANRYTRDSAGVSAKVSELIEKSGGEMLASRLWEERRLAYPINGQRKGTYWLTYFKLDSGELDGLIRQCQLTDSIMRTLFLKVDPRISDALVSHALADPATLAAASSTPALAAASSTPAPAAASSAPAPAAASSAPATSQEPTEAVADEDVAAADQ